MTIEDDTKNLIDQLLEIPNTDSPITTTVYSLNYNSRDPNYPFYQNPHTVPKLLSDGTIELVSKEDFGQPAEDNMHIPNFTCYTIKFDHDKLERISQSVVSRPTPVQPQPQEEIYEWKELVLNLSKLTIEYRKSPPKHVSFTQPIKFLKALMASKNQLVTYEQLSNEIGISSVQPDSDEKVRAGRLQEIRQDLIDDYLMRIGMPKKAASTMIDNVRWLGYRLI